MDLIRVGAFELYPTERLLCAAGKPVEVGARAFDLLLVLAENPGRLVTKAVLIERVWPRLVVDENNLPAQIASLRRVLGVGAIRTVPRFGYRLDLPVSRTTTAAEAATGGSAGDVPRLAIPARPWGTPTGPLVGREEDLAALDRALARDALVTLVGGAGVGKSRLAQEVLSIASGRPGACGAWVSLEPLDDASHVPSAIALALGLSVPDASDRYAALRQALEGTPLLLVLDGAEHLAEALGSPLAALVYGTRGLRALVTSQTPLARIGESVYRLGPLPMADAVALFRQRAAQADRRFAPESSHASLVGEICRRLDGNPLALELAAARVPAFGLRALLERLNDRFRLLKLSGGDEPRHGVLQAAFDWSYSLLSPVDRSIFDRLGAFAGSFSLDAATRAVADEATDVTEAVDSIGRLVDRSLVTMLPAEPARYTLLETARCYARARLGSTGALARAERRMAEAMLDMLDRAYDVYWSLDEEVWLHRYEPELDNVRAAFECATRSDARLAVSLYGSAWPLFVETDLHSEGRAGHAEAVALLSDALPPSRIGRFWEAVATYDSGRQGDRARYAAELAARMYANSRESRSQYYATMQWVLNWRDDLASARETLQSARRLEDPSWPARLLAHGAMVEGMLLTAEGNFGEARAAYRRALDHALSISERQALAATVNIVELDIASGSLQAALQLARPLAISLRHSGRRETRYELLALTFGALLLAGEIEEARGIGVELFELAKRLDLSRLHLTLDAMALFACLDGRDDAAARVAITAEAALERHGQARRRPAVECIRTEAWRLLDARRGPHWRSRSPQYPEPLDEETACLAALGLRTC